MNTPHDLLAEFDALSTEQWVRNIQKHLKENNFDSIFRKISEDLSVKPFYRQEETEIQGAFPAIKSNNWKIAEGFCLENAPQKTNQEILVALEGGVELIELELASKAKPEMISEVLKYVHLSMVSLHLKGAALTESPKLWVEAFLKLPNSAESVGSLDLSNLDLNSLLEFLTWLSNRLPNWNVCNIKVAADESQIVANLATALFQTEQLIWELHNTANLTLEKVVGLFRFEFPLSDDYFLEIARIRAFKRLWLALLEAYQLPKACFPNIHAFTSNNPQKDGYWSMISATTQTLSAAIAQVSSITVTASEDLEQGPDFSRRIARNVQHLLKLESHIDAVIDPSAGSYYVENFTELLVSKTWEAFLNLKANQSE